MKIDLNDENMRGVIAEAVMKTLTADTRQTVIAAAIEHLLTPPKRTSGCGPDPKSPLQEAFDISLRQIAQEEVKRQLAEDESLKGKIRELVTSGVEQLFALKDESIGKIADTISDRLSRVDVY